MCTHTCAHGKKNSFEEPSVADELEFSRLHLTFCYQFFWGAKGLFLDTSILRMSLLFLFWAQSSNINTRVDIHSSNDIMSFHLFICAQTFKFRCGLFSNLWKSPLEVLSSYQKFCLKDRCGFQIPPVTQPSNIYKVTSDLHDSTSMDEGQRQVTQDDL